MTDTIKLPEDVERRLKEWSENPDTGLCADFTTDGYAYYEELKIFLADELAKARAEERERIADEFGDFRLMAKGWLGIIKYGRTLRFFLLPHTKHKKGDDESN